MRMVIAAAAITVSSHASAQQLVESLSKLDRYCQTAIDQAARMMATGNLRMMQAGADIMSRLPPQCQCKPDGTCRWVAKQEER
jgi:hypothetical protein